MRDHVTAKRSIVGVTTRMTKVPVTSRTVVEYIVAIVSLESFRTVT